MEYEQGEPQTSGYIATGLRQKHEVTENEDGTRTFEVPSDLDAGAHQRLIDAGHTPLEPDALPSGVTYEPGDSESGESDFSSGSEDGPTDGPSESEEDEETASGEERTGSMTSDVLAEDEEPPEPPEPLDEMNRSELYAFGNEELGLELSWSGEEALNEEEMRERIAGEVSDGE